MSLASVAAQQSAASSPAASSSSSSSGSGTSNDPLSSLSSNFGNFLKLLMTQLQNRDPTSPLDTNQFTSELVQFSSVEQQINTNTSLTQLIQLTQAGEIMQSSAMVGKQVSVTSDHVPLQNGSGTLHFTTPSAEPVSIAIYSDAGTKIRDAALAATKGRTPGPGMEQTMPATASRTAPIGLLYSRRMPMELRPLCLSPSKARPPGCRSRTTLFNSSSARWPWISGRCSR